MINPKMIIFSLLLCSSVYAKNEVFNGITTIEVDNISQPTIDRVILQSKRYGWSSITVNGDYKFKRAVWLTANANGIRVIGFAPDQEDINQLRILLRGGITERFNEMPYLNVPGAGN